MTNGKRVLIPIYELLAKEIKGYTNFIGVNIQTWVVINQTSQVQGALKSQLQRHGSCLHQSTG